MIDDDDMSEAAREQRSTEAHARVGSAPAWAPLVNRTDAGGYRDYLDGEPISHGAGLELQAVEEVIDPHDGNERMRRLATGIPVRYETVGLRDGGRRVVLHTRIGGHEFRTEAEPWMRFRWRRG